MAATWTWFRSRGFQATLLQWERLNVTDLPGCQGESQMGAEEGSIEAH
jgi:hypothetical protein